MAVPERADQRRRTTGTRPAFDREAYRRRNIVERVVGWRKERRRIATRYEKLAVNHLAMGYVAMIEQCLRLVDSSDRAVRRPPARVSELERRWARWAR